MAKINVKLRPSKIGGKPGTIYYQVSHLGIVRHIATPIRLLSENWDEERQHIRSAGLDDKELQTRIDSDLSLLHRIVGELTFQQEKFAVDDIVARFRSGRPDISVLTFLQEQVQFLTDCNRLGTATNYYQAAEALSDFLKGRSLRFTELTPRFVERYSDYLSRKGLVRNSLSFHMRILRAVYNKAVRYGYIEQSFPFRDVYTGVDRTRKRAVSEEVIKQLMQLNLTGNLSLSFARDMFLFSFYTRGMSFVDMAYLRKSDMQDGVIRYIRHKTGQTLSIRVEPCIREIVERYAHAVRHLPYLLPILQSEERTVSFRQYKSKLRSYNRWLQQLSQMLGLASAISSYTSRHSWATTARNHNVPISVISAGMGHASERTTQIYLNSLEDSLVDNANRKILERFHKSLSC